MKNILIILCAIICLCSCNDRKHQMNRDATDNAFSSVREFTYKNHEYIKFMNPGGSSGVVHDPDCTCHNKE